VIAKYFKLNNWLQLLRSKHWLSYPKSSPSVDVFEAAMRIYRDSMPQIQASPNLSAGDATTLLRLMPLLVWWGERESALTVGAHLLQQHEPWGLKTLPHTVPESELLTASFKLEILRQGDVLQQVRERIATEAPPLPGGELAASLGAAWRSGQLPSQQLGRGIKLLLTRGERAAAEDLLKLAAAHQSAKGTFPESARSERLCLTGLLEMASAWFMAGDLKAGEAAYGAFLQSKAHKNFFRTTPAEKGGFSPLMRAATFLETLRDRVVCTFEATAPRFPTQIAADDGRFKIVDDLVAQYRPKVVADIGCGKGRFIKLLKERHPEIEAYAVDLSTTMLGELPASIHASPGTLLNNGLPDGLADLVFCVEALEHAVNIQAGVRELSRITSPTGRLLILDKDVRKLGSLQICDWEQWFGKETMTGWMEDHGFRVKVLDQIDHGGISGTDRLFLAWIGERKAQ
jgi:SAM-dependent methyltransferase